jgi:hypothetical protein
MGVYATVSRAPAGPDDTLDVLWVSASDGVEPEGQGEETDLRWAGRGGVLPDVGDDALLFTDSRGDPWAVCWPSGATSPISLASLDARVAALEAGPEAVTAVAAFANSWVNFDADRPAAFYRDRGRVFLTGIVKSGTLNTVAFTLPAGYRPASVNGLIFPAISNGALGVLTVTSTGAVVPNTGSNVYFTLDGISFRYA